MGNEILPFLPYSDGIPQGRLRVGHLCVNIYNPSIGNESNRFGFKTDEFPALEKESQKEYEKFIEKWTGPPDIRTHYSQSFTATKKWFEKSNLINLISTEMSNQRSIQASIGGSQARRYEIYEPQKFTTQVVLQQPGVEAWVRDILSVQAHGRIMRGHNAIHSPKIWVCTGLLLLRQGTVKFGKFESTEIQALVNADIGALTSGLPSGQSVGQIGGGRNTSNEVQTSYTQRDEHVWAAQWQQLEVTFGPRKGDGEQKPLIFRLKQIESREPGFRNITEAKNKIEVAEIIGLAPPLWDGIDNPQANTEDGGYVLDERPYSGATKGVDWKVFESDLDFVGTI